MEKGGGEGPCLPYSIDERCGPFNINGGVQGLGKGPLCKGELGFLMIVTSR